jgi:hypothetical protein
MIDRRELLTLGGLLGLAPADTPDGVAAGNGQSLDARALGALADELHNLRTAVLQQYSFDAILPVRKSQQDYLKANGKFPDFIDLGIDVWTAIHDWHIRLQQPLVLGRDVNGRYTMMLGFTALVLRQDAVPTLIGIPYDQR